MYRIINVLYIVNYHLKKKECIHTFVMLTILVQKNIFENDLFVCLFVCLFYHTNFHTIPEFHSILITCTWAYTMHPKYYMTPM